MFGDRERCNAQQNNDNAISNDIARADGHASASFARRLRPHTRPEVATTGDSKSTTGLVTTGRLPDPFAARLLRLATGQVRQMCTATGPRQPTHAVNRALEAVVARGVDAARGKLKSTFSTGFDSDRSTVIHSVRGRR